MKASWKRRRVLVDLEFQGRLCLRVIAYWLCCISLIGLLLCWREILTAESPQSLTMVVHQVWQQYGEILLISLLLLPLVLLDVLIFSNRIAGPMNRMLSSMRKLADGEEVEQLKFRRSDMWQRYSAAFNGVAARLNPSQREPQSESGQDSATSIVVPTASIHPAATQSLPLTPR